jgi:hypothetical protein
MFPGSRSLILSLLAAMVLAPPAMGAVTFSDQFTGSSIDSSNWDTTILTSGKRWCASTVTNHLMAPGNWQDPATAPCHGITQASPHGSVSVAGGQATLSAGVNRTFPYMWSGPPSKANPFPASGDFSLEVRMKFNSLKPHGTQLVVRDWPDSDPVGNNPPGGNGVFNVGAGSSGGLRYSLVTSASPGISGPLDWHTYRLEYSGGSYSLYIDGVLRDGPIASSLRPNAIWFGNPVFTHWGASDWTDFTLDYVTVDTTVTPPPDVLEFGDEFNGSALDPTLWNTDTANGPTRWCSSTVANHLTAPGNWQNTATTACHGITAPTPYGNITVAGGTAAFSAGTGRAFPWVYTGPPSRESFFASPDFPATGNFSLEARLRFPSTASSGTHAIYVTRWANTETIGNNPPAGQTPIWGVASGASGLIGTTNASIADPSAFHVYRLDYVNGAYSVFVDGVLRQGPVASTVRPTTIWMGNPVFTFWTVADWTDFTLDYVRMTFPPPRPTGAATVSLSLVPAFDECTEPDREHGPGLDYPSCSSPNHTSPQLTIGTPDSNGKLLKSAGRLRTAVIVGDPGTPADDADVRIVLTLNDVRRRSDLEDYAGELEARLNLRITDRLNGPGLGEWATMEDMPFSAAAPCSVTVDTTVGSTCDLTTSADALVPGSVIEGKRAMWQMDQPRIYDGGADGDADTVGDNTLFAVPGVLVP